MYYRVLNTRNGRVVADRVKLASRFGQRLIGLLNRRSLSPQEGLLLTPCRAVHTLGMRFAVDVIFLNDRQQVVKIITNMPPNRFSPVVKDACTVLELAAGRVDGLVNSGDQLLIEPCPF